MSGADKADHGEDADQGPYFFLSYVHQPRMDLDDPGDPNGLIMQLYRDLAREIVELTDVPPARAGFVDRDIRVGHEWPKRITDALATCRVFIPLYQPRYFSSENCGKEWFAFHKRQVEHEANVGRRPEAIIPVLWVPVEERVLPEAARSVQFDHHRLGEIYARDGFSQLIKVSRFRDDYNVALRALAAHIVQVATYNAPEPARNRLIDYANLDCAFGSDERKAANRRRLTVTIVADDYDHLPQQPAPRVTEYYRPGSPTQWNPYRPESKISLAEFAANMARGMGLVPDITWFDETAGQGGAPSDDPGLMIVDPWASLDLNRGKRLREFGQEPKPWIQPMIPWNASDAQTAQHESVLRQALEQALLHTPTPLPTLQTFGNQLPKAINLAVRNYLRRLQPHPPVGPDGSSPSRLRLRDTENAPEPPEHFRHTRHRPPPWDAGKERPAGDLPPGDGPGRD